MFIQTSFVESSMKTIHILNYINFYFFVVYKSLKDYK